MKIRLATLAAILLFVISAAPIFGHHDVLATYDRDKESIVTGKVTQVMWVNPHALITLDVKGADGKVTAWKVDIAPIHTLSRIGFGKDTVAVSSSITVKIWPARDGSRTATGRMLTLSNGKQFDVQDALGWKPIP